MSITQSKELDDIIIYKNAALLNFALTVHILSKSLYGTEEYKNDSNGYLHVTPIIESYRSAYFDGGNYDVDVDLLVNTKTTVNYKNGSNKVFDGRFTFHLLVSVCSTVKSPKILGLVEGDAIRPFDKRKSLSRTLVPYIYRENYEDIATEFLEKYYEQALELPVPVSADEIISKMGFNYELAELSAGDKGMFAFREQLANCYNRSERQIASKEIPANTVLVDYRLESEKGIGSVNDTKIHECLHWYLHKRYIELGLILRSGNSIIVSADNPGFVPDIDYNSLEDSKIIEEQCKNIAPLVLMPKGTSIVKFNQLLEEYNNLPYSDAYELAIRDFASFFGVSKISAKIRLRALGYSEQPSIIDKKYLLSVNGETRFISKTEYENALCYNEILADLDEKGFIKYIDGYAVINTPDFVEFKNGRPALTAFALKHLYECTLRFNSNVEGGYHNEFSLNAICLYSTESTLKTITLNETELGRIVELYKNTKNDKYKRSFFKDYRVDESDKYSEYLITLMERHNISIRNLAKESHVSKSVIDKYRSYTEAAYTVPITLALCAGMHAYPYETFNLLKAMGVDIETSIQKGIATERNKCYHHIITTLYDKGIDAWNEYLRQHKQPEI